MDQLPRSKNVLITMASIPQEVCCSRCCPSKALQCWTQKARARKRLQEEVCCPPLPFQAQYGWCSLCCPCPCCPLQEEVCCSRCCPSKALQCWTLRARKRLQEEVCCPRSLPLQAQYGCCSFVKNKRIWSMVISAKLENLSNF